MMQTIRTIIIDDERYACERLRKLLVPYSQIRITDYFTDSKSGLKNIFENKPDLVFLDVELENGVSAFDLIEQFDHLAKKPHIILVTAHPHYSIRAIKHEVFDYLLKPVDIDELENTIDRLLKHFMTTPVSIIERFDMLSEREKKILSYVLDGKSSDEIASFLFISRYTVNTHRRNILKKTGARSFLDLMRMKNS
jgi:DNA-binding NarL/FixJ family response regulator